MPDALNRRIALPVGVVVAFGAAFVIQLLPASSTEPAATHGAAAAVTPDLRLAATATLPALRQPRKPRVRTVARPARVRPARTIQPPVVAPTATATATATAQPAPTSAPQAAPPAPAPAPRHVPAALPAPTAEPPSGDFDTTGSGEFDSGGEP